MTSSDTAYNQDDSACLFAAGSLKGKGVSVDPASLAPVGDGRVYRGRFFAAASSDTFALAGGEPGTVAVKSTEQSSARQPRNLAREAKLLSVCRHPHILALFNAYLLPAYETGDVPRFLFFSPFYPFTLRALVSSQRFLPEVHPEAFQQTTQSISWQLLEALRYLHDEQGIAHRDVSPNNVLLSRGGRVVLADFGIAIRQDDEPSGKMHFEVGTGAYRAPELLFGAKAYDAQAIDLWAAAATLAEMFTPFDNASSSPAESNRQSFDDDGEGDDGWSARDWAAKLGIKVNYAASGQSQASTTMKKRRTALFGESKSDLALVGAIFKARGTPNIDIWPEAAHLPDWGRFEFTKFDKQPLSALLPSLQVEETGQLHDLLDGLLAYSAAKRIKANEAVRSERWDSHLAPPDDYTETELRRWRHGFGHQQSLGQALSQFIS